MSTDHIHHLAPAAAAPAELPPLPIGALAVAIVNLLDQAADLPQPRYITISSLQNLGLQFGNDQASFAAITRWALRFGGIAASEPYAGEDGPETLCRLNFDYYGIAVEAYAFIQATTATT